MYLVNVKLASPNLPSTETQLNRSISNVVYDTERQDTMERQITTKNGSVLFIKRPKHVVFKQKKHLEF